MVSSSMMAVVLSCGFAAQVPDRPGEWVVIESKEGPFSFAMPARPVEQGGEAPIGNGTMRWKIYTYKKGEDTLIFRLQIYPPGARQDAASRLRDIPEKGQGVVLTKATINVRGVSGMELVTREESPTGKGRELSRMRVLEQGPNIYTIVAQSGPGKPVPPEAAGFLGSIRFDGKPAARPAMAVGEAAMAKASAPAARKQIGKIVREDRTADAALRTFLAAMEAGDEETLRAVTLPNPDFDRLLRGEATITGDLKELKDRVRKARVERLRSGDRVRITPGDSHEILPSEVGRDRAALRIQGAPAYAPMQLVKGRWKVDPAPIIAARKAAEGAK